MTTYPRIGVLLCLAAALTACEGDARPPTALPDGPAPGPDANLVTAASALTCDYLSARAFARDYFGQPERREVGGILRDMQAAFGAGDTELARELGFDVLAVVEAVVNAGTAAGTPADGSNLTNAVLACMDVGHGSALDFSGALALFGAYGVRGGAEDPPFDPVLARESSPLWGAEPADGATWAEAVGPRRLAHAAPLSSTGFTSETPASSAYRWGAVPTPDLVPFPGELAVGACLTEPDPRLRVQRSTTILPFLALGFCADASPSVLADGGGRGLLGRLTGALAAVLVPHPLHATSTLAGGVGGRLGSFSPVVVVDAGAVNLVFTQQPTDALVGEPIPVQVTALGNGGTPLPEVTVTLAIEGNNASFGELSGTTVDVTGTDGVATFLVALNKTGGFRLTAAGDLAGFPAASATSDLFHIKQ